MGLSGVNFPVNQSNHHGSPFFSWLNHPNPMGCTMGYPTAPSSPIRTRARRAPRLPRPSAEPRSPSGAPCALPDASRKVFERLFFDVPSGEHTKSNGKIHPCFMGKSTISMAIFNCKLLVHQRVSYIKVPSGNLT